MTDLADIPPPQPLPDLDSEHFWQATAKGHLELCRCTECGHWHQPPLERCRKCAGPTAFQPIAGTGTVHTFIVQRQGTVVGYFDDLPYTVALVELDEQPGLRLPGRMVGIAPDEVSVGLAVKAKLVDLPGGDYKVAVFEPA